MKVSEPGLELRVSVRRQSCSWWLELALDVDDCDRLTQSFNETPFTPGRLFPEETVYHQPRYPQFSDIDLEVLKFPPSAFRGCFTRELYP